MTMIAKSPRMLDAGYLRWLRRQPCCCGCRRPSPSDAAHIRAASLKHGKPYTGKAEKPSDHWALPVNHAHHMAQHAHGDELGWWSARGIDPFELAIRYYRRYGGDGGSPRVKRHKPTTHGPKRKWPTRKFPKRETKWS